MTEACQRGAYLDYAATAPFDERLVPALTGASWANANSLYAEGREARRQLDAARKSIACSLGARQPAEVIFTSGGTEGDNTAIKGLIPANMKPSKTHVIVSSIEHHAVLDAAAFLKRSGYQLHHIAPEKDAVITPGTLDEMMTKIEETGGKVGLVCVMAVNNELGTIQPIRELAKIAHAHKAKFFTDGVQALGKLDINLEQSGVDAASFSGHKIGAPKGTGVLYLRRGTKIEALLHGGGQEMGLRSGTSNVPGACALAQAIELATAEREQVWERVEGFKQQVIDALPALEAAHGIAPTLASNEGCVPHVLSLLADGLEGETLVQRLDARGVSVSSGSACSTGSLDPSHVLTALGIPKQKAYGSLRVSFGARTSQDDVDYLLRELPAALR